MTSRPELGADMKFTIETMWFALICALFLAVNLTTGTRSPTVWIDEVSYADPAVNLVSGKGFTSSAWYAQSKSETWAGNTPLYPLMLSAWIGVFGVDILQVRSMNYMVVLLAVVCVWVGLVTSKLITNPSTRLWMVALLLCGYNISFVYRGARPDSVLMLLFALVFLASCLPNRAIRYPLLAVSSFLIPAAGFSGLPLLAFSGLFWLIATRLKGWREVLTAGAASAAGLVTLLVSYQQLGLMEAFLASTQSHSSLSQAKGGIAQLLNWWAYMLNDFKVDGSLWALLFGVTGVLLLAWRFAGPNAVRSPLLILIFSFITPIFLIITGKFIIYYGWILFVPLVFVWGLLRDSLPPQQAWLRHALVFVALVSCAAGLPLRLGLTLKEWQARDYAPVRELASKVVRSDDIVYSDQQAYYAVKPLAAETMIGFYLKIMTPEEKESVSLLLVNPTDLERVSSSIGGVWQPEALELSVAGGLSQVGAPKYNLSAFRRVP
jgi:hypothetical protein